MSNEKEQAKERIIQMAMHTLDISRKQAELRVEAMNQSGLLEKYKDEGPNSAMFKFVADTCMQIPQLHEG